MTTFLVIAIISLIIYTISCTYISQHCDYMPVFGIEAGFGRGACFV